jgi:hypothetical protein
MPDPPFDTTLRPSTMGRENAMGPRGLVVAGFVAALVLGILAVRFVAGRTSAQRAGEVTTATAPATEPSPEPNGVAPVGAGIATPAPHIATAGDEGPPSPPTGSLIGASPMPTVSAAPSASAAPKRKKRPVRPGSGKPADEDVGF